MPTNDTLRQDERLDQWVEGLLRATHARQILLARAKGLGDRAPWACPLDDAALKSLADRHGPLVRADGAELAAWARGRPSAFDPREHLAALRAGPDVTDPRLPVSVIIDWLGRHAGTSPLRVRALASLLHVMLEVDRDGDLLQDQLRLYRSVGLPLYQGQVGLEGSASARGAMAQDVVGRFGPCPFDVTVENVTVILLKMWMWGRKHLGLRDRKVLADELLAEPDVAALAAPLRALPPRRIAVIGHSFTMDVHWSSPSAFVPIAAEILSRLNPGIQVRHWSAGGLTPRRAQANFLGEALEWKPDEALLVLVVLRDEEQAALERIVERFGAAGTAVFMFDNLRCPAGAADEKARLAETARRQKGLTLIEVEAMLRACPDWQQFLSVDGIHATEPYHRRMAKEWLRFLAGARPAAGR